MARITRRWVHWKCSRGPDVSMTAAVGASAAQAGAHVDLRSRLKPLPRAGIACVLRACCGEAAAHSFGRLYTLPMLLPILLLMLALTTIGLWILSLPIAAGWVGPR